MPHSILEGMRVCFRIRILQLTFIKALHVPGAVLNVLHVLIHLILIAVWL